MSLMTSLILFYLIMVVVIRVLKVNRKSKNRGREQERQAVTRQDSAPVRRSAAKTPLSQSSRTARTAGPAGSVSPAGKDLAKTKDGQASTTEYLRQKAIEDERAHAEEARIEELRLHHETGGRMPAMRHYDGDSVPRGMHIVRCGYCAAENLIRDGQKQSDCTCYFCREIL